MIVLKIGMAYGKAVQWHLLSLTFTLMHWYLCSMSGVVTSESLCCISMVGSWWGIARLNLGCRKYVRINEPQFADDLALLLIVLCLSWLKGSLFS